MADQTPTTYRAGDRVIVPFDATSLSGDIPLRKWLPYTWSDSSPWEVIVAEDGPIAGAVRVHDPRGSGTTWIPAQSLKLADSTPPAGVQAATVDGDGQTTGDGLNAPDSVASARVVATLSLPIAAAVLPLIIGGLEAAYGEGLILRSSSAPRADAKAIEVIIPEAGW